MTQNKPIQKAVASLLKKVKFNPKALLATIYVDMLLPHGGMVWLGSLVEVTKAFDIPETLSRTSALRLVYDGWLSSTRIGKLSFYSMTSEHIDRVLDYYPRIYGLPRKEWDGEWHIFYTGIGSVSSAAYKELRQALRWQGIGQLAPHVFISPTQSLDALNHILRDLNLLEQVQIFRAEAITKRDTPLIKAMVEEAWDIKAVAEGYDRFLSLFRPVWQALDAQDVALSPEQAFIIRTFLILEYRRMALKDPQLPEALLTEQWAGYTAFNLCRSIYQAVLPRSIEYLQDMIKTADGPLPPPSEGLYQRFGGIDLPRTQMHPLQRHTLRN